MAIYRGRWIVSTSAFVLLNCDRVPLAQHRLWLWPSPFHLRIKIMQYIARLRYIVSIQASIAFAQYTLYTLYLDILLSLSPVNVSSGRAHTRSSQFISIRRITHFYWCSRSAPLMSVSNTPILLLSSLIFIRSGISVNFMHILYNFFTTSELCIHI